MSDAPAREISIAAARDRFTRLVHEVEQGPPVALTRRGEPVAVLLSIHEFARLQARGASLWDAVEACRAAAEAPEAPAEADPWADVRDRSAGRSVTL